MKIISVTRATILSMLTSTFIAGCGSGGSSDVSVSPTPSQPKYALGGAVTGLSTGSSVTLSNGVETISINANGQFAFAPASGFSSSVVVTKDPGQGIQCALLNASNLSAQGGSYPLNSNSSPILIWEPATARRSRFMNSPS